MKIYLKRNGVLYFWAVLDLFYIARFVWLNISQGRIPLVDDIFSFSEVYPQQGAYALVTFSLSLLLNISVISTAVVFLKKWKYAHWVVYFQTPLRLFFTTPSVSILPWVFNVMSVKSGVILISVVFISEIVKLGTFYLTRKDN